MCLRVVLSIAYNSLSLYAFPLQPLTYIPVCLRTLKSYCVPLIFTQSSEDFPITSQELHPTVSDAGAVVSSGIICHQTRQVSRQWHPSVLCLE